jgi:hypothetical protein
MKNKFSMLVSALGAKIALDIFGLPVLVEHSLTTGANRFVLAGLNHDLAIIVQRTS